MFTLKILINNLNPFLRLSSIDESNLEGSYQLMLSNRQIIRHNGRRYVWEVK